jgi:hypothetical protein
LTPILADPAGILTRRRVASVAVNGESEEISTELDASPRSTRRLSFGTSPSVVPG